MFIYYHAFDKCLCIYIYEADYEKKIEVCKQKTERAKSEVAAEAEVDHLQKELEEELEKERALQEELR